MKTITPLIIIVLVLFTGAMGYFYFNSFTKNKKLTLALQEAQDFRRNLQEEISRRETLQENLQKENEELKKESLSYLSRQKEMNDQRQRIEKTVKQQNDKLKDLRKKLETTQSQLQKLKEENSKLANIHSFAGNVQVKKQEERIAQLEEDLSATRGQIKKQEALLHYNLGVTYTKEKNYEMAIDEYEKVLSLNSQDADTHYNLAILYDELGKSPKRAIQHYQKYLELRPDAEDIDEVREWIASLMLGEVKAKAVELGKSPGVDMTRAEKIKGIFLKKTEELPQRGAGQ